MPPEIMTHTIDTRDLSHVEYMEKNYNGNTLW